MLWDCGRRSSHAEKFGGEVSWRSLSKNVTTRRLRSAFDGRVMRAHCRIVAMPAGGTSAANYWEREIRHVLVLGAALRQAKRHVCYARYCVWDPYASRPRR